MTITKNTKFLLIFIVLLSQIFSPILFFPGGEEIGLSIFRTVIFVFGIIIFLKNGVISIPKVEKNALYTTLALSVLSLISIIWSENVVSGIKHFSYFLTIAVLIYVFSMLVNDYSDFRRTLFIFSLMNLVIVAVAFYEINSGIHFFRSSLQDTADIDQSLSYISENQAWFTFGNPNDLCVHIALATFMFSINSRSIFFNLIYIVLAIYLSNELNSRIIVFSLLLFISLTYLLSFIKKPKNIVKISIFLLILGVIFLIFFLIYIEQVEFLDSSSFVRLQLISSSIEMAKETLFLGVGTGSFETEMWQKGYLAKTIGISNPHNGFGRVLAENGVLGLLLFLYILFGPLLALRKAPLSSRPLIATISLIVVIPLLISVGSDPLSSSSLQLAIAFIWVATRFAVSDGTASVRTMETAGNMRTQSLSAQI